MVKKQNDEVRLLKQVVAKLCDKLKDYQKQLSSNKSLLAQEQASVESIVNKPLQDVPLAKNEEDEDDPANYFADGFAQLLGGHTIGPLVKEYEDHIAVLTKDIKTLKNTIGQQAEIQRELMSENEKLAANLEIKQREYLRLIDETRANVTALEMLGAEEPGKDKDNADGGDGENNDSSKERIHLLTEENHILFEQVTLLRAHHD